MQHGTFMEPSVISISLFLFPFPALEGSFFMAIPISVYIIDNLMYPIVEIYQKTTSLSYFTSVTGKI